MVPETPLWTPSAQSVRQAAITGYMDWAAQRQGRPFDDYDQLWQWSVTDLEGFWASVWEYGGVRASVPYQRVLADARMPGAQWFTGAQLNFAENVLARSMGHAGGGGGGALAVLHQSELRGPDTLTRAQLRAWVATVAGGLRELGVESGDRVVAYMPNIVETLVAFLAVLIAGRVLGKKLEVRR